MTDEAQLSRIFEELQGLRSQVQSLVATINNNNTNLLMSLTSLQARFEAHEHLDESRFTESRVVREEVSALREFHQQAKGAAQLWRVVWGAALAVGGVFEAWLHLRKP